MDVLHDNSYRTWLSIGENHGDLIPTYVDEAPAPDAKTAESIERGLFADSTRRLFPIDTAASTWLSAAYFSKNAADGKLEYIPEEQGIIWGVIQKAAEIHGITADVEKIAEALTSVPEEKCAADQDDNYGWVMRDRETGELIGRKYPMFDDRGVKLASDYFGEYRARYPQYVRTQIAGRIMQKAAEYGVKTAQLCPAVLAEAGYGVPDRVTLMNELNERAQLTKDAEDATLLANLNNILAVCSGEELGGELSKLAEVIDDFDRNAGLVGHYGTRLMMPADFLYSVDLDKAAEALEDAVELDKHVFSLSKLAALGTGIYDDVLGDWFTKDIVDESGQIVREKMADALYSLPKPDKAALEEHIARIFA